MRQSKKKPLQHYARPHLMAYDVIESSGSRANGNPLSCSYSFPCFAEGRFPSIEGHKNNCLSKVLPRTVPVRVTTPCRGRRSLGQASENHLSVRKTDGIYFDLQFRSTDSPHTSQPLFPTLPYRTDRRLTLRPRWGDDTCRHGRVINFFSLSPPRRKFPSRPMDFAHESQGQRTPRCVFVCVCFGATFCHPNATRIS